MKTGYSLLLGEHIEAIRVAYKDCELFQIVCPCCKEPIFKVVRPDEKTPLHYLSHYEKARAYSADCELRVNNTSKEEIDRENTVSRDQRLSYFLRVFRTALLENEYSDDMKNASSKLDMLTRSHAIAFIRNSHYDFLKSQKDFSDQNTIYGFFNDYVQDVTEVSGSYYDTEFSLAMQKKIAFDMWIHLLSPQSRPNYDYLFSHAYLFLMFRIAEAQSTRTLYQHEVVLFTKMEKMMNTSKHKAQETLAYLLNYPTDNGTSNLGSKMFSEIMHEMLGTLLRLPYFTLIKKAIAEKSIA